jgi:hypothetical protein
MDDGPLRNAPMRLSLPVLSLAVLMGAACVGGGAVFAQQAPSANYTSIEAEIGKSTQIGFYAQARKDCSPTKMPVVRVAEAPTAGTLTVRPGQVTTRAVANCPDLHLPAQIVFYNPRDGIVGNDHVMYSVTYPDGEIALYDVSIRIKEAPKTN